MEDREKIVRLNIEYYKKLFEKDPDETRRQMLMRYLDEEQAKQTPSRVTARRQVPRGARSPGRLNQATVTRRVAAAKAR
jgi:hypothetical protein